MYTYMYIYVDEYVHICIRIYVHMYVCMYVCMYIYKYKSVCVCTYEQQSFISLTSQPYCTKLHWHLFIQETWKIKLLSTNPVEEEQGLER